MKYLFSVILIVGLIAACGDKELNEEELFAKAQQYENAQEYNKAIEHYTVLIDKYPQGETRYKAIFMLGFISYEYLKMPEQAIEYFDQLLAEYPDSDLADDAAALKAIALQGKDILSIFEDSLLAE